MATHHGHLTKFDGNAEDWEIFTEQLSHYLTANGITDEAKKRSILLSACGTSTYKLVRTLVAPDAVTDETFEEMCAEAQHHYHPKPSVIMRRFQFNTCVRHPGEKVTTFIARLRDLASHCDYGGATAELVRDRLVCGIRDDALQRSLLSIAKLTFDKACELALLHESAEENSMVLSTPTAVHRTERQAPATADQGTATATPKTVLRSHATVAEGSTLQTTAVLKRAYAIFAGRRVTFSGSAEAVAERCSIRPFHGRGASDGNAPPRGRRSHRTPTVSRIQPVRSKRRQGGPNYSRSSGKRVKFTYGNRHWSRSL